MNFMQRLMYGRYGGDQFSVFLIALYLLLYIREQWWMPLRWEMRMVQHWQSI